MHVCMCLYVYVCGCAWLYVSVRLCVAVSVCGCVVVEFWDQDPTVAVVAKVRVETSM